MTHSVRGGFSQILHRLVLTKLLNPVLISRFVGVITNRLVIMACPDRFVYMPFDFPVTF
jgi:molybdopterin biosynthesis enzyme MoaB